MFDLLKNILQFTFTVAYVIFANYVVIVGVRDLAGMASKVLSGKKKKKAPEKKPSLTTALVVRRALFWLAFCAVTVHMLGFIFQLLVIVIAASALFRMAEKTNMSPGRVAMLTAAIMIAVAARVVNSQPVLMKIENQFSVDLWVYNAANSLIDFMVAAAMKVGMDTSGIQRMASLVPYVQENMFVFLSLSLYVFCAVTMGVFIKMILPDTGYEAPVYYRLSPEKFFLPAAALMAAFAWYFNVPQLYFVIGGVYYAWGVNLLVFALRGGWWPVNMLVLFAGLMHPAPVVLFIVTGALDNLFDFRRLAAVFGALGGRGRATG